jgi:ankyrin repeat protein
MPVYFHFRYDFFNLRRPRTLVEAITKGNVRAVEKFLQTEGLETGPSAPPYLVHAILLQRRFYRREYTPTDKQKDKWNETSYKMVELLVEHGADINQADECFDGNTPLMAAIRFRMHHVVRYLIEQGASVDIFNEDLESPLMYPAWFGDTAMVQLLLDHNAKETINHARKDGRTVLHLVSCPEVLELLLRNGADPTIKDLNGQTLLERARNYNMEEIIDILEKHMKINEED